MKKVSAFLMVLGVATLAACGETERAGADATNPGAAAGGEAVAEGAAAQPAGEVFSGKGDITELSGDKVTISHGPIEGIGWPAMTMGFSTSSPDLLRGLNVGDPVSFQFQKAGSDYVVTSISKAQ